MSGLTAKELRAYKSNLFYTPDSIEDSIKYATDCLGNGTVVMLLMIHTNAVLEHLAKLEDAGEV